MTQHPGFIYFEDKMIDVHGTERVLSRRELNKSDRVVTCDDKKIYKKVVNNYFFLIWDNSPIIKSRSEQAWFLGHIDWIMYFFSSHMDAYIENYVFLTTCGHSAFGIFVSDLRDRKR